ncbi:endo-arabinase [Maribacter spongiicola]|uniref:endo-arabinase n=1 Tax=Maribacter spongiicola TaxID=1206753 RepID=UPI003F94AFE8
MKYVFLVLLFSMTFSYAQTDEEAIISLLERESSSWRSGDVEAHASCWSIQPYSRIFVSMADGNSIDVPPAMMINPPEHLVGKGGTSKNSNYKMNISGNNAWVTHDEESTTTDGVTNYTYEMRILEKIDGNWKLVGQSIHPRKMK